MKKLRTSLCTAVLAASVCLVAQRPVSAQEPTPSPEPSPSPPALINGEPTAAIADAAVTEEEPEKVHSKKGKFPPVAVPAEEIMTVQLRFRLELAGALLILQPLDGGGVSAEEILIGEDGTASVDFLPPTDPGTYRVLLNADGELSVLQFKVEQ